MSGDDNRSRSLYLQPPSTILDVPLPSFQAAPTPVHLKKNLYPLPTDLTDGPKAPAAARTIGQRLSEPSGLDERSAVTYHKPAPGFLPLPERSTSYTATFRNRTNITRLPQRLRPSFSRKSFLTERKTSSVGIANPIRGMTESTSTFDSWTLKVSKFDIMKLKHELEGESVKEKMKVFEAKYLKRPTTIM